MITNKPRFSTIITLMLISNLLIVTGLVCNKVASGKSSIEVNFNSTLITKDGKPSQVLLDILKETGIKGFKDLKDIIKLTQEEQPKGWLRKPGKERWEMSDPFKDKEDKLFPLFEQAQYLQAADLSKLPRSYDYAVMMGSTLQNFRKRFKYLIDCSNSGMIFKKIVFLCGERNLDSSLEPQEALLNENLSVLPFKKDWAFELDKIPNTEYDMIKMVYEQTDLPENFKNIPVLFVNAPKKPDAKRATSKDAVEEWLKENPTPGSCFMVSNSPYTGYQGLFLYEILPSDFTIYTVGPEKDANITTSKLLDAMTRELYQIGKILNLK